MCVGLKARCLPVALSENLPWTPKKAISLVTRISNDSTNGISPSLHNSTAARSGRFVCRCRHVGPGGLGGGTRRRGDGRADGPLIYDNVGWSDCCILVHHLLVVVQTDAYFSYHLICFKLGVDELKLLRDKQLTES